MDRGGWRATVHAVAKNQTQLKQLSTHMCDLLYFIQYFSVLFPLLTSIHGLSVLHTIMSIR